MTSTGILVVSHSLVTCFLVNMLPDRFIAFLVQMKYLHNPYLRPYQKLATVSPSPPVLEYHKSGNDCLSSGIISLLCADSFEGSWILPFLACITVSDTGTLFDVYNLGLIVDFYNLAYMIPI